MKRRIKICFITTGLETGGAEMMLYKLLSGMDRERFKPSVISLRDKGTIGKRIEELGISVYTTQMRNLTGLFSLGGVIKLVKEEIHPDIIQGWMYHGNLVAQFINLFQSNKIPVAWSIHNSLQSFKAERIATQQIIKLSSYFSRTVSKIIYVARKVKSEHEDIGFKEDKGIVIPNGFDTELYKPSPGAKEELCKELAIPENSFLIGLVGRYHAVKDHQNFLQAAEQVLKQHDSVCFILAGRQVNSENSVLTKQIEKLGIGAKVKLLDERKDIPRILSSLDLACSSSYSEAFPLILGEAMACGTPCVATDVGDSAWIVGDTGFIVPSRDSEALAKAFLKAFNLEPVARKKLGAAARLRIIEKFSLESIVTQYEAAYERLMEREKGQKYLKGFS